MKPFSTVNNAKKNFKCFQTLLKLKDSLLIFWGHNGNKLQHRKLAGCYKSANFFGHSSVG